MLKASDHDVFFFALFGICSMHGIADKLARLFETLRRAGCIQSERQLHVLKVHVTLCLIDGYIHQRYLEKLDFTFLHKEFASNSRIKAPLSPSQPNRLGRGLQGQKSLFYCGWRVSVRGIEALIRL